MTDKNFDDSLELPANTAALDEAIAGLDPEEQALVAEIKAAAALEK